MTASTTASSTTVFDRCACNQARLTMIYDHTTLAITGRLGCVGTRGRRSCGFLGPVMSLEEAEEFETLAWARSCLVATAPAAAKVPRLVGTR